jgi:hypothetical protein
VGLSLLGGALAQNASAGTGSVTPPGPPLNATILRGEISLTVNFPTTPSAENVFELERQMAGASRILCDATEGQIRIRRVETNVGLFGRQVADIWWLPQPGRAHATPPWYLPTELRDPSVGRFGSRLDHITLFDNFWPAASLLQHQLTSMRSDVIAHELGHTLFGLFDMYDEQLANDGCGFGPLFDGNTNATLTRPLRLGFAVAGVAQDAERVHSIMQQVGTRECRRPAPALGGVGTTPFEEDQRWGRYGCLDDCDCNAAVAGCGGALSWSLPDHTECSEVPSQMSELDIEAEGVVFDPIPDHMIPGPAACPAPRPGNELVISGTLNPAAPVAGSCGDGVLDEGEECEAGDTLECQTIDPGLATGDDVTCIGCRWDAALCGGMGTHCTAADAGTACTYLWPPSEGAMGCHPNGTWDRGACSSFVRGRRVEVLDAAGDVRGDQPSVHGVEVVVVPIMPDVWDVHVAIAPRADEYEAEGALLCGNGVVDPGEECEPGDVLDIDPDPELIVTFAGGRARCDDCLWDYSAADVNPAVTDTCGNGVVEDLELCDGPPVRCQDENRELRGLIDCVGCIRSPNCALAPEPRGIAVYRVSFDPATGNAVDANGLGPSDPGLELSLGDDQIHPLAGGFGHYSPTGAFQAGAPGLDVRVDFAELRQDAFADPFGGQVHQLAPRARASENAGLDQPQIAACSQDAWCTAAYNPARERFDSTVQRVSYDDRDIDERSGWAVTEDTLRNRATRVDGARDLPLFSRPTNVALEPQLPLADTLTEPALAYCNDPPVVVPPPPEDQPRTVYVFLDRSARMATVDPALPGVSRLEAAAANAQMYLQRWASQVDALGVPAPPDVVVGWFTGPSGRTRPGEEWLDVQVGTLGQNASTVTPWPLRTACPGAGTGLCTAACCELGALAADFLTPEDDPGGLTPEEYRERLIAYGTPLPASYPMSLAYGTSLSTLNPPPPSSALILTDQIAPGEFGSCTHCPNGFQFVMSVSAARGLKFIYSYTGPVPEPGSDAQTLQFFTARFFDQAVLHDYVSTNDSFPIGDFTAAAERGEALALVPQARALEAGGSDITTDIYVEPGARELTVSFATRHGQPFDVETGGAELATWAPEFQLLDPTGDVALASGGSGTIANAFFQAGTLARPEPGMWTLVYEAPSAAGDDQFSYMTAYVSNPKIQLLASPSPTVIDDTVTNFAIHVETYFDGVGVEDGVSYSGVVRGLGFEAPLTFISDPLSGATAARVSPLSLPGAGAYEVVIRAEVAEGSSLRDGENLIPEAARPKRGTVPAFTREIMKTFHLDTPRTGGIPPDCDQNGIPNQEEPAGDLDQDGVSNACDPDDDGDSLVDAVDPDPQDPLVPFCGSTASLRCCETVFDCEGLREAVLYGDATLRLKEGVLVFDEDELGLVVNAGSVETSIGVDVEVGSVLSAAAVQIDDGALVSGDVQSAFDVTLADDADVTGTIRAFTPTVLPGLGTFDVPFPSFGPELNMQPGQVVSLAPSARDFVKVERDAVLKLSSGFYYFRDLHVEPEGTIEVNSSAGPIRVYVENDMHFKGSVIDTHGLTGTLFIGFLGTGTAHLLGPVGATVAAPFGTLNLDSAGGTFYGAFLARELRLEPHVTVLHEPFIGAWYPREIACSDGMQNGGESDADCGGPCDPCEEEASCNDDGDCELERCISGLCDVNGVEPTCSDGLENGDESGLDCGGSCAACPTCNDGVQNGEETGMDCGGGTCNPCGALPEAVWLEAEEGTLTGSPPFVVDTDAMASGGSALRAGSNSTSTPGPSRATYTFTVAARTYRIWGRVSTPDLARDSFWVSVDGGPFVRWNEIAPSSTWTWDEVHDSEAGNSVMTYPLTEGNHTLVIANRESGTRLDRLYITSTGEVPSGPGGATCSDALQNGTETGVDCGGNCPPCPEPPITLLLQAEAGTRSGSPGFSVDSSAAALGGQYLTATANNTSAPGPDRVTFTFSTNVAATYVLWGRVLAPNLAADSFWVSMDGGPFVRWNEIASSGAWAWDQVHDSDAGNAIVTYPFTPGQHSLTVANREIGTRLDAVYLAADGSSPP